jgi:aspartyl-tRNA(Asn)/glutamyl-tRNA(Gln) amidotransferase subunit C
MNTPKAIDIDYLASLARLDLSAEEKECYTQQIQNTLQYLDKLNSVDVSGIKAESYSFTRYNVWAEDVEEATLDLEATLLNAPERSGQEFQVPAVIDEA